MGAAAGGAPGRGELVLLRQRSGLQSPPPCYRGTKAAFSAPNHHWSCSHSSFPLGLSTLGLPGQRFAEVGFGALRRHEVWGHAGCGVLLVGGETLGLKPARKSHGVCLLASGVRTDAAPPCPFLSLRGTWEAGKGGSVMGGRGSDFALLVSPLPQVRFGLSK